MIKTLRNALLVCVAAFIPLVASAGATKQDAQALVEKAAAFAASNGKEKLVAEANKKDGSFNQGDLYVFVFDMDGTLIANPAVPASVGKNELNVPDADGKLFRKDIVATGKAPGKGWVDYKWLNPASGKVEAKTSYVMKQGDVIIGAGVFVK